MLLLLVSFECSMQVCCKYGPLLLLSVAIGTLFGFYSCFYLFPVHFTDFTFYSVLLFLNRIPVTDCRTADLHLLTWTNVFHWNGIWQLSEAFVTLVLYLMCRQDLLNRWQARLWSGLFVHRSWAADISCTQVVVVTLETSTAQFRSLLIFNIYFLPYYIGQSTNCSAVSANSMRKLWYSGSFCWVSKMMCTLMSSSKLLFLRLRLNEGTKKFSSFNFRGTLCPLNVLTNETTNASCWVQWIDVSAH